MTADRSRVHPLVMPRAGGASSTPRRSWDHRRLWLLDHPPEPVIGRAFARPVGG